jgi:hypothetical protein
MHRSVALAGVLATLAVPSLAHAGETPTSTDRQNATSECRAERGATAATREAFKAHYGTNANKRNAFGKCVSAKSREEAQEREDAQSNGAQTCRTEQGTTAASRAAFEQKYGTGKNKRNAFGKCVSQAAKAAKDAMDDKDDEAAGDRKSAAAACDDERGDTAASKAAFAAKYGTNTNKRNAFGKCVSRGAKARQGD